MTEKEILEFAIIGVKTEIDEKKKALSRDLLLMQAHKKGLNKRNSNPEKVQKRIADTRAEIDGLMQKKGFLVVQLEECKE